MLDFELIIEVLELNVAKLSSIVGDEHKQNPKPNNNILLNKFLPLGHGDCSQWLNFYPLGEVVHGHDEELSLHYRHGERTEDIDPHYAKGHGVVIYANEIEGSL